MRTRSVRAAVASLLWLGLAVVLPSPAAAEPVGFAHGTVDQTLTTTKPNSPTGFHFVGSYHAAGDPDSPPPYMQKMRFYNDEGSRWDTSVPGQCTASDLELATLGPAACPEDSRLGGGTTDILFMGSFPNTVAIDVFNNTGEQIMLGRSPGLTTVIRGRLEPDGSVEYASPTCFPDHPGCMDNVLQLRSDITVPPYTTSSGATVRSYMTSPPKCPRSGYWTSPIRWWWKDGSEDTVATRQPCTRPKAKRKRKRARRLR